MYRTLSLLLIFTVGLFSCAKEEEASLQISQAIDYQATEKKLKDAQQAFFDVLTPLRALSSEELQLIAQKENPLEILEEYTQINKEDFQQKAAIFQESLEAALANQTTESKNQVAKILMSDFINENTSSFMATPCYNTYERNLGLATASLAICVYGTAGTAGCLIVYGLTVMSLDADFEACLVDKY